MVGDPLVDIAEACIVSGDCGCGVAAVQIFEIRKIGTAYVDILPGVVDVFKLDAEFEVLHAPHGGFLLNLHKTFGGFVAFGALVKIALGADYAHNKILTEVKLLAVFQNYVLIAQRVQRLHSRAYECGYD